MLTATLLATLSAVVGDEIASLASREKVPGILLPLFGAITTSVVLTESVTPAIVALVMAGLITHFRYIRLSRKPGPVRHLSLFTFLALSFTDAGARAISRLENRRS